MSYLHPTGELMIHVYEGDKVKPIKGAKISVIAESEDMVISLATDESGQTSSLPLCVPGTSPEESDKSHYAQYSVIIEAQGYYTVKLKGVQVFEGVQSIQEVELTPATQETASLCTMQQILITEPTYLGNFPDKDIEETKTEIPPPQGVMALPAVTIPQYVVVHIGNPCSSGPNYRIPYKNYIKNVICSEIDPNWHIEAIKANIICITSFTLNRIFTEHYAYKGFTITSSTSTDQAYTHNRNIYKNISNIVDEIFDQYIKIPSSERFEVPFLSQYRSGKKGSPHTSHPGILSQWGSQYLAVKENLNAQQILEYYYGKKLKKVEVAAVKRFEAGVPESYPGHLLKVGSHEPSVKILHEQLNEISKNYPAISKLGSGDYFDENTEKSVKTFQKIAHLKQDGIVGRSTWYKISDYYAAIKNLCDVPRHNSTMERQYSYVPNRSWIPAWMPVIQYKPVLINNPTNKNI